MFTSYKMWHRVTTLALQVGAVSNETVKMAVSSAELRHKSDCPHQETSNHQAENKKSGHGLEIQTQTPCNWKGDKGNLTSPNTCSSNENAETSPRLATQ
jgi:hypothetical protein